MASEEGCRMTAALEVLAAAETVYVTAQPDTERGDL